MSTPLHVVLGASGGIGGALVAELAHRGHRVRAVTRTGHLPAAPPGVEVVAGRSTDPGALPAAVRDADIVFYAAQPDYTRWVEDFPALNDAVADAAARAGATLVVADNLYMYGPHDGPLREDTPQRASDKKGLLRAEQAARLLARHDAGELRVVLGRASDYYGPGGTSSSYGAQTMLPLLTGSGPVPWIGDLDALHTAHFLPDLARGLVVLAEHEQALGRAWHLPAAPPITGRQFLDLAAAGSAYDVDAMDEAQARALGAHVPIVAELADIAYQWAGPWTSDTTAFTTAFGALPTTPHEIAVPRTTTWFRHTLLKEN